MTLRHSWPRMIMRGHLFGMAVVPVLATAAWLAAPALRDRLLAQVGADASEQAAAQATVDGFVALLGFGALLHVALNTWLWLALRRGRGDRLVPVAAGLNLLSVPIGTVLGLAVLAHWLQQRHQLGHQQGHQLGQQQYSTAADDCSKPPPTNVSA